MKFDYVIGNPPYQESDGGNGVSAVPVYQYFVNQALSLNPESVCMITPSRWFSGGRGLKEFREQMLSDKHIHKLVDYENFKDVFPGVDLAGGACYFVWNITHNGKCQVINATSNTYEKEDRALDAYPVFIRSNKAVHIVDKIVNIHTGRYMDEIVSASKPFGLRTFYKPKEEGIPCAFIQKIGIKYAAKKDITDTMNLLDKWKLIVPRSPIAGQTDFSKPVGFYYDGNTNIIPPGTCCTESFIIPFASHSKEEVENFKSYLFTKTVRFLLLQCVVSQDVTREKYRFIPHLEHYDRKYTDEFLCKLWNIDEDEWKYIDSKISNIGK